MPRLRPRLVLTGLLIGGLSLAQAGADEAKPDPDADFVAAALARRVIGPRQTLGEAVDYCESAVPPMPKVANLADWEGQADRMRAAALKDVIFRGEAAAWRDAKIRVEWLGTVEGGPGYRVRSLRYEALPGLWIPALLYEPESMSGKVPVVLNVNGHDGKGKAADYKQIRCINLAKKGLIALNLEWFGMGQFRDGNYRHDLINHIDLCGTGGIATHYLAMSRGLDLLLSLEHADPARVAVTGLSGGGWQTIFISAFDTRVTLTNPVAGYSSFRTRVRNFSDLGDSEQTPCDLATVTDYAQMTAMMAPRATLLTFNLKDDCCFASDHALPPLLEAARPVFALHGKPEKLRSHVNTVPGTHNYLLDNRLAFYRMVADTFYPGDSAFNAEEVASDSEVRTPEALNIPLPKDNVSLHSLALELSKPLPLGAELPTEKDRARSWRDERLQALRRVVRPGTFEAVAHLTAGEVRGATRVTHRRFRAGEWSVPVVELARGTPRATAIVLADAGRKSLAARTVALLGRGVRVLAVDPFYVGEAKVAERDYLFALLLAAVGDRPLGLQASQLVALARWAKHEHPAEPVTLIAAGRRTSTMALVAAGLDERSIDEVEVSDVLGSLKELIESKREYREAPELFCFGLLREFDVKQLAALVAPRKLTVVQPGERAKAELAGLKAWYAAWGVDWEPLR